MSPAENPRSQLRILTISSVYPNPDEPGLGIFVRTRLQHLAALVDVKVVAPVSVVNYSQKRFRVWRTFPYRRMDGAIEVFSPRWLYPPGGGASNALFLFFRLLWTVVRIRKSFHFDVIDAHFAHPEGVAAMLLGRVLRRPVVITLRGNEQLHSRHLLRRKFISWALRRAAAVIAVAEKLRQLAIGLGADPNRVVTIPNGIDTQTFYPRDRATSRSQFNIPPQTRVVVSAGHLIELKGHHRIIQAVHELSQRGLDVMLLVAGGRGHAQDFEPALRKQIAGLHLEGRVRLLGHVDREVLASALCAADIFCLASSREGWPNVLHEALACGTPVVATNVGGVPEMIPSTDFGLIVPPSDDQALLSALGTALGMDWNRQGIAAWGQARSWPQVAAEVLNVLESAAKGAPTSRR